MWRIICAGNWDAWVSIRPRAGPAEVVVAQRERNKTLVEMAEPACSFTAISRYDEKAANKHLTPAAAPGFVAPRASALRPWIGKQPRFIAVTVADALGVAMGSVAQPLRVAVSGTAVSPPIDLTLEFSRRARAWNGSQRALIFCTSAAQIKKVLDNT